MTDSGLSPMGGGESEKPANTSPQTSSEAALWQETVSHDHAAGGGAGPENMSEGPSYAALYEELASEGVDPNDLAELLNEMAEFNVKSTRENNKRIEKHFERDKAEKIKTALLQEKEKEEQLEKRPDESE